jgi:hypothetical protein
MHAAPLIYITSSPSTSTEKLLVARHLVNIVPHTSSHPPILVDGHVSTGEDVAFQIEHKAAFGIEVTLSKKARQSIVIVTDSLGVEGLHARTVGDVLREKARRGGKVFVPVVLMDSAEEDGGDVGSAEGDEARPVELLDAETLKFGTEEEIVIDVAGLRAEEVAAKIARWVWWVGEFMSWGNADGRDEEELEE